MIKYGSHNTATLAFKKQLITLYNMKIIKTKVDNSNGFGDGTLKAVKEAPVSYPHLDVYKRQTLMNVYNQWIKPAWDFIVAIVKSAWENWLKPVFEGAINFYNEHCQ